MTAAAGGWGAEARGRSAGRGRTASTWPGCSSSGTTTVTVLPATHTRHARASDKAAGATAANPVHATRTRRARTKLHAHVEAVARHAALGHGDHELRLIQAQRSLSVRWQAVLPLRRRSERVGVGGEGDSCSRPGGREVRGVPAPRYTAQGTPSPRVSHPHGSAEGTAQRGSWACAPRAACELSRSSRSPCLCRRSASSISGAAVSCAPVRSAAASAPLPTGRLAPPRTQARARGRPLLRAQLRPPRPPPPPAGLQCISLS